jgi:hypothetical protein
MRLRKQAKELRNLFDKVRNLPRSGITDAIAAVGIHLDLQYDSLELGKRIGLTEAEYRQFKLITTKFPGSFLPAGLTRQEAKAIRNEVNRPGRNAAERERRQANAADKATRMQNVADIDCRMSAIYTVLTDQPQTMREMMKALARSPAFRMTDGKSLLTGGSLKKAIQRALKEATLAARVEIKRDRYKNGRPIYLFSRGQ